MKKAEDIHAYDNSNIVFLGYDIYIPDSRVQSVYFTCKKYVPGEEDQTINCFGLGRGSRYKGAGAYKMDFGSYSLVNLEYIIKTGTRTTTSYYTDKKGKYHSSSYDSDVTKTCTMHPYFNQRFTVAKNHSPYLGRFVVYGLFSGNACAPVEKSTMFSAFDKDVLLIKDSNLRRAIRRHIDR